MYKSDVMYGSDVIHGSDVINDHLEPYTHTMQIHKNLKKVKFYFWQPLNIFENLTHVLELDYLFSKHHNSILNTS
jgi:hypothetical protein